MKCFLNDRYLFWQEKLRFFATMGEISCLTKNLKKMIFMMEKIGKLYVEQSPKCKTKKWETPSKWGILDRYDGMLALTSDEVLFLSVIDDN